MKTYQIIRDVVIFAVLAFLAFKQNELLNVKPEIKETVKYVTIEKPTIKTVTKEYHHTQGRDSIVYISTTRDSLMKPDTLILKYDDRLFRDTLKIDSTATIYAVHKLSNDSLTSYYDPIIKQKEITIEKKIIVTPLRLYGTILTDFKNIHAPGISLSGLKFKDKQVTVSYNYSIATNQHFFLTGINLLK